MTLPFLSSAPGDDVVVVEGDFNANVERMYRAWTDAGELMKWFGPAKGALAGVDIDLRVGGRICFEFATDQNKRSAVEGTYLEIVPNQKVAFTWSHVIVNLDGEEKSTPHSRVTITFTPEGERTHVRLCHEGIATQDGRDGVSLGWTGAMEQLQTYCLQAT